jgi:hypothetical protein
MWNDSKSLQVRVGTLKELDALVGRYLTGENPQTFWEDGHSFLRFESIDEALGAFNDPYFRRCFPDGIRMDHTLSEVHEFRPYSSDLVLAWEVVERMSGIADTLRIRRERNRWVATFGDGPSASASAAPVAICLAALRARGIEVEFAASRSPDHAAA